MKTTIKKILKKDGAIDCVLSESNWKGYRVYEPIYDRPFGYYGLPEFILVDSKGNARKVLDYDEIMEIYNFIFEREESEDKK